MLTAFEWRVLRDIANFGTSGRGSATQPALDKLFEAGMIRGPFPERPAYKLTLYGLNVYEDGEPKEGN